jgi:hypothetical protein
MALFTVTVRRLLNVLSHEVDTKTPARHEVNGRGGNIRELPVVFAGI